MNIRKPITARQMKKLASLVTGAIPSDLPSEFAQKWIDSKRDLEETIRRILLSKSEIPSVANINWKIVYELLGMKAEYEPIINNLKIDEKNDTTWAIPVLKGLTCKKVVACLKKLGANVKKDIGNPDDEVKVNDRDPKRGSYFVSFRRAVEADEENRNLSADDLKNRGEKGITLLERLLLELGYFASTGQHLDVESVTLCAGSVHKSGYTPRVCCRSGVLRIFICWCGSRDQCDHLRPRSVFKETSP